jgi:hypothetical protein
MWTRSCLRPSAFGAASGSARSGLSSLHNRQTAKIGRRRLAGHREFCESLVGAIMDTGTPPPALIVVALVAVVAIVMALGSLASPHARRMEVHAGRGGTSVRISPRLSGGRPNRHGERRMSPGRSLRVAPLVRVPARNSSSPEVCVGLCSGEQPAETGEHIPPRSGSLAKRSGSSEDENAVEFGFEE